MTSRAHNEAAPAVSRRSSLRATTITFVALASSTFITAAEAQSERYVVDSNGERVGHLHVTRMGTTVETDFLIDDNGRGPKIRETWQLGPDGLPREFTLSGKTTFGSAAKESSRRSG
jgi:hypothetical protein